MLPLLLPRLTEQKAHEILSGKLIFGDPTQIEALDYLRQLEATREAVKTASEVAEGPEMFLAVLGEMEVV